MRDYLREVRRIVLANLPIKDIQTIEQIKRLYKEKYTSRDLLLFVLSINTGLNLKDLLNLNVGDVKGKYYICTKDNKNKSIPINEEIRDLIKEVISGQKLTEPLFKSNKSKRTDRIYVYRVFRELCEELGVSDKYSVSSWRKTFAYHYYQKYKDLSYLMWLFNQYKPEAAFKFMDIEENMNLRFREGVGL